MKWLSELLQKSGGLYTNKSLNLLQQVLWMLQK